MPSSPGGAEVGEVFGHFRRLDLGARLAIEAFVAGLETVGLEQLLLGIGGSADAPILIFRRRDVLMKSSKSLRIRFDWAGVFDMVASSGLRNHTPDSRCCNVTST